MSEYIKQNYHSFDAQVSENLCQIRPCKITTMHHDSASIRHANESIFKITRAENKIRLLKKNKIEELISTARSNKSSFEEIISFYQIEVEINKLIIFLICTFLLCEFKTESLFHISTGIDYQKLSEKSNIKSKTFLKKLIQKIQRLTSKQSSEFILSIAKNIRAGTKIGHTSKNIYAR